MKYDRNLTVNHPLSVGYPQYLERIDQIVLDEGGTQQIFNGEVALNLDKVKTNSGERDISRLKSMDMIIGLNNTPGTTPQTLLVDFKLRCNGIRSISTGDCKDKIESPPKSRSGSFS